MITTYKNGNSIVSIDLKTGTRIIETKDGEEIDLEYPLNLDLTFFEGCSLNNYCSFCHIHNSISEAEGDYNLIKKQLSDLPGGIELAIACNKYSEGLHSFLAWAKEHGFICNLTVNQIHYPIYYEQIKQAVDSELVYGVGISLRDKEKITLESKPWEYAAFNPNFMIHTIVGLDTWQDIQWSLEMFSKVVILGYKKVGNGKKITRHGQENIDLLTKTLAQQMPRIFKSHEALKGSVISFDNLAIKQLQLTRFFNQDQWDLFYNGEFSLYIDTFKETINKSSYDRSFYLPLGEYTVKQAFDIFKKTTPEIETGMQKQPKKLGEKLDQSDLNPV